MPKSVLLCPILGILLLGCLWSLGFHRGHLHHHAAVSKPHFCIRQGEEDKLIITENGKELTLRAFGTRIRELAAAQSPAVELDGCGSASSHRLVEMMGYCRRHGLSFNCITLLNAAPVGAEDMDLLPPVYLTIALQNGIPVFNYGEQDITLPQFKVKLRRLVEAEEDQPVVFVAQDELTEQQWEDIIGSCMEDVRGFDNYGIEAPDRSYPYRRVHRHTAD